jgi:hypothetical protein
MFARGRAALLALVAPLAVVSAAACTPATNTTAVTTPAVWVSNFAPLGYSSATNEVFGNRLGADGAWNAYAINVSDKSMIRSLTAGNALYGTENTHRAVSDVSPDGKFMLMEVERPDHFPCFNATCVHAPEAAPGKGSYNQVWLATTDGTKAWQLSDIAADQAYGTFWARFDTTGNRIVFAEIMHPADLREYFGGEQLVTGQLTWTNGVPSLTGRVNLGNAAVFNEPYGFTPDGSAVIANSDELTPGYPGSAKIMLFPLDGSAARQLTSTLGTGYQEFAFLRPDRSGYVVSSGYLGWINGTDRWLISSSTPNAAPVRVTHFADPATGHPQSGISGGMAFVSNTRAAVGFSQNGVESAYLVTLP